MELNMKLCEESDLIKRVRKILQSGDAQIIDCLQKNLLAYEHILDKKKEMDQLAENCKRLEDLERRIAEYESERKSSDHQAVSPNARLSIVPRGLS